MTIIQSNSYPYNHKLTNLQMCQHVRMKTSVLSLEGPTHSELTSITDSQSNFSVCPGWSLELFTLCDQSEPGPDKKILTNLASICSHVCPPVSGITWFIGVCVSAGRSIPANFMQMKPPPPPISPLPLPPHLCSLFNALLSSWSTSGWLRSFSPLMSSMIANKQQWNSRSMNCQVWD